MQPPPHRSPRRSHLRRRGPIALAAAVLLVGACSGSGADHLDSAQRPATSTTTGPTTTLDPESARSAGFPADWRPEPLVWRTCDGGSGLECATLAVPRDWDEPGGPTVELALARSRATGDRIGSLLVNPGGPGGSGIEFLGWGPFVPPITERFDVVSWDPRGVGASTTLSCGEEVETFLAEDTDPDDTAEQRVLEGAAAAVAEECGAEDADLLPHVGTADVARDLEAIRLALGGEPLNYLGYSYGTQIGQQYAELFPATIRAMVLDGVVDPSQDLEELLLGQTRGFEASFTTNVRACARAGADRCGVEDLAEAYDRVLARVESEPLPAARGPVGPAELAVAATSVAYAPDGWADLGAALADGLEGDGRALRELADAYYDLGGYTIYAAVTCLDTPHPEDAEAWRAFAGRAERISPRFGAAVANEMLPCATWPVDPAGAAEPLRAPGAPPILVVGNTGDPATPYENARTVAATLESGVLVTADIDGHTAYGTNPCVTEVVDDYLVDLRVPERDPRCG